MVRDFQLPRACRIRIQTVDETGNPVRDIGIYSASLADERWGNSNIVSTNKKGWATIGGLKPSAIEYIFGTTSKNYGFAKLVRKLDDPTLEIEEKLVLSKGEDVSGIVLCSDGKPAAGWTINAMPDWWHFGASPQGAKIADDGSFTFPHVVKGKYDVTVSVPTSEGLLRQERALSEFVLPSSDGELEIRLGIPSPQSMTAIAGEITTLGNPRKEMIRVSAWSENGQHRGNDSIGPGEYDFRIGPLPPGRYTLNFSSTEIEQKRVPNVQAPSDNLEVELNVTGKPRLSGIVVHAGTGEPLSRFRIRVRKIGYLRGQNYGQGSQWRAIQNAQGKFAIDVVGPGIYQIVVAAKNLATVRSEPINTDEYQGEPLWSTKQASRSTARPFRRCRNRWEHVGPTNCLSAMKVPSKQSRDILKSKIFPREKKSSLQNHASRLLLCDEQRNRSRNGRPASKTNRLNRRWHSQRARLRQ